MANDKGKISDRLWVKAAKMHIPLTAAFELLPICNLNCRMCYVRKSKSEVDRMGGLLDGKQWLEYIRETADLGLLYPLFTGGEPFLHPDFREILTGIQKIGLQVSINSNATLITRETAEWLGKHAPARINITLYGASEQTYQNLCGDGDAFRRVRNAVQWLKENGVRVKFNASITPQNVHDLEKLIAYAKEVESPIQVATYMFPPIRRDAMMVGTNERLSPEEAALARVKANYLQNDPNWFLIQAERFRSFVPVTEELLAKNNKAPMKMRCRAGNSSLWIDWQGNLVNCGMYGSVKIPLKGRSLSSAWDELVEKTSAIQYVPACAGCPNVRLCHPCIAMVSNECGDVNGRPEYLCRMNEASAKYYLEYAKKLPDVQSIAVGNSEDDFVDCGLEEF